MRGTEETSIDLMESFPNHDNSKNIPDPLIGTTPTNSNYRKPPPPTDTPVSSLSTRNKHHPPTTTTIQPSLGIDNVKIVSIIKTVN